VKTIGKVRRLSRPSCFVCDGRQLKRYNVLSDRQPVQLTSSFSGTSRKNGSTTLGTSEYKLDRLQRVQNRLTRVEVRTPLSPFTFALLTNDYLLRTDMQSQP